MGDLTLEPAGLVERARMLVELGAVTELAAWRATLTIERRTLLDVYLSGVVAGHALRDVATAKRREAHLEELAGLYDRSYPPGLRAYVAKHWLEGTWRGGVAARELARLVGTGATDREIVTYLKAERARRQERPADPFATGFKRVPYTPTLRDACDPARFRAWRAIQPAAATRLTTPPRPRPLARTQQAPRARLASTPGRGS